MKLNPTLSATLAATLGVAAAIPAWAQSAAAPAMTLEQVRRDKGFSYFMGIAQQRLTYREEVSVLPVRSRASVVNPLLVSGALYEIDKQTLLSVDSETTFAPGRSTERWTATAAQFNGTTLTDPLVQSNGFRLSESSLRLLAHSRVNGPWFVVTGPAFHSQSFRRFSFQAGPDRAVDVSGTGTVEETAAEVLWQAGVALDSERVRSSANHYGLRATIALPLWRRVDNTSQPETSFSRTSGGYDLNLEGRYSVAVAEHIHLGAWGRYALSRRPGERQGMLELPRSRLDNLSYGLELLWKL